MEGRGPSEPPDEFGPAGSAEPPAEPPAPPELESLSPAEPGASAGFGFVLPEWLSFLRNRLILGGLSTVLVLLLVAIVLVAMGGGDGGAGRPLAAVATPEGTPTPFSGEGLTGRVRVTVSLRNGPGSGYPILGIVPAGALVSVIGRNTEETWLQVVPSASGIPGWVPVAVVEVSGDIAKLAIGEPGRSPSVPVPTLPPGQIVEDDEPPELPPPPPTEPPPPPPPSPTATPRPPTATPVPPTPTPPGGGATPPRG